MARYMISQTATLKASRYFGTSVFRCPYINSSLKLPSSKPFSGLEKIPLVSPYPITWCFILRWLPLHELPEDQAVCWRPRLYPSNLFHRIGFQTLCGKYWNLPKVWSNSLALRSRKAFIVLREPNSVSWRNLEPIGGRMICQDCLGYSRWLMTTMLFFDNRCKRLNQYRVYRRVLCTEPTYLSGSGSTIHTDCSFLSQSHPRFSLWIAKDSYSVLIFSKLPRLFFLVPIPLCRSGCPFEGLNRSSVLGLSYYLSKVRLDCCFLLIRQSSHFKMFLTTAFLLLLAAASYLEPRSSHFLFNKYDSGIEKYELTWINEIIVVNSHFIYVHQNDRIETHLLQYFQAIREADKSFVSIRRVNIFIK